MPTKSQVLFLCPSPPPTYPIPRSHSIFSPAFSKIRGKPFMPTLTDVEFSLEGEETRNALDGVFRAPGVEICPFSVFQSGERRLTICGPYVLRDGVLAR